MAGSLVPDQMFTHRLDAKKGWPSPYAVDKRVQPFNSSEGIVAGMGLFIDPATHKAKRGSANGSMPLFAWQGQNEFDVNGDVGNIIAGYLNTLVAIGGYELETTEFVTDTYAENDLLTVRNTVDADRGKLQKTAINSVDMIVGVVSEAGPAQNSNGVQVIRFWPVYMPNRS